MHAPPSLPTAFETLAGVVKFIAVPKLSVEFYVQHQNSVETACTFLKVLASNYSPLEAAFRKSLPLPIIEGANYIEASLREIRLPETKLQWLNAQTTAVLKALVPVVRSQNLPDYLAEARWAVLGAFENDGALAATAPATYTIQPQGENMGLFDMFRSQKPASTPRSRSQTDAAAWVDVAGKLSGTLWQLMQRDPKMLMNQYARVVLDSRWNVGIAADYRDPDKVLGANDVAFVFLREDMPALKNWIQEMQSDPTPMFQQIATEEFAKKLTRTLASRVDVAE